MATSETRTGFRLPWGAESRTSDDPAASAPDDATDADATTPDQSTGPEREATVASHDTPTMDETSETQQDAMLETTAAPKSSGGKRPTKFLADLTKAMQAAAEAERSEILSRFQTEAKTFTEQVHERSGAEAADLRKVADEDIAGIRDWSKAEIARIREETENRISGRRAELDDELESHAARIEREIERVKAAVDGFEAEMARFFETLGAEDDPGRFAALAASLPEPPSLDDIIGGRSEPPAIPTPAAAIVVGPETPEDEIEAAEAPTGPADAPAEGETQAEAVPVGEADAGSPAESEPEVDPRVAALSLTPDFAAAEAEALAAAGDGSETATEEIDTEVPSIDEETIAARLADLVPASPEGGETVTSQLAVAGLASVASIAGFKRHLARLPGVRTVGVSSGPDGEFLFAVTHDPSVDLREAVPGLPGFAARISGTDDDGVIRVAARDPEADA